MQITAVVINSIRLASSYATIRRELAPSESIRFSLSRLLGRGCLRNLRVPMSADLA